MNAPAQIAAKPKKQAPIHNGKALTGVERAGVLLLSLGQEHGQDVWKLLDEDEVRELSVAIARLGSLREARQHDQAGAGAESLVHRGEPGETTR